MKYLRVRPATRFGGFELEKDTSLYLPPIPGEDVDTAESGREWWVCGR